MSWVFKSKKKTPVGLFEIRHSIYRSLSWLCEESIMAGIFPVEAEASLHRWWISPRAMTDCSQSHEGLLPEPLWTPHRAMTYFSLTHRSFFQQLKNSKTRWKTSYGYFLDNYNHSFKKFSKKYTIFFVKHWIPLRGVPLGVRFWKSKTFWLPKNLMQM